MFCYYKQDELKISSRTNLEIEIEDELVDELIDYVTLIKLIFLHSNDYTD